MGTIGTIPNPTKKVTVNFPINKVKQSVKDFPLLKGEYKMIGERDSINFYTLSATEFLSFGVEIDISLTEVSETSTEISIEVKRALGSFDQSYEVTYANNHINTVINGIADLLENSQLGVTLNEKKATGTLEKPKNQTVSFLKFIGYAVLVVVVLLIVLGIIGSLV